MSKQLQCIMLFSKIEYHQTVRPVPIDSRFRNPTRRLFLYGCICSGVAQLEERGGFFSSLARSISGEVMKELPSPVVSLQCIFGDVETYPEAEREKDGNQEATTWESHGPHIFEGLSLGTIAYVT